MNTHNINIHLDRQSGYDYHVDDLGESDLQCDVDNVVSVLHWPQSIGVVREQVSHQLLSIATMSGQANWGIERERDIFIKPGSYLN